jgi:hypothetical protein
MAIEGPLRELSIQDVLQMLDLAGKTGVLTVRSQRMRDEAVVHLLEGELVFATRRRSMRLLGQQLLRQGKLTEPDLERALEVQQRDPSRRLGAILVATDLVDATEVDRQLRAQIEETIYDLVAWEEGYFRFEETDLEGDVTVRVRVDSLLMEGARRLDEWLRLGPRVPGPDAIPVLAPGSGSQRIDLKPEEWEVLAEVDGERDLRTIASDLGRSALEVARAVDVLAAQELITLHSEPQEREEQRLVGLLDELELLLADGRLDEAEQGARELQRTYPDRAELPLLAGRALAAKGRLRAALECFEEAVALDPLSLDAHYQQGLAAAGRGDLELARQAWSNFLRLAPAGDRKAYVERAMAAMTELRNAVQGAPRE